MLVNNTVNGLPVDMISDMWIMELNDPGIFQLGDDFFLVHDSIHYFTGIGVSVPEEYIVKEIQMYMQETSEGPLSEKARFYITRLLAKGVYTELKLAMNEAYGNLKRNFEL